LYGVTPGKYTIQLFNVATGKWDEHTIDESVPCRKRSDGSFESVVANPYGEEIWVPLLEKAMAKHFGGYRGIGNGRFMTRFRMFLLLTQC